MPVGKFEVILGPMFSGKSTELIRKLTRAQIAGKRVILFKPQIDQRYHPHDVVSHDGTTFPATAVANADDIYAHILDSGPYDIIGIDEAQFLGVPAHRLAEKLAGDGYHVILAGLNVDFLGRPWDTMVSSVFRADTTEHLTSVCVRCGDDATRNQRIVNGAEAMSGELTAVGGVEAYEARCRTCFVAN